MTVRTSVCVWLKRDLRVTDHAALATAVERSRGGAVFAVFFYEPEVLAQPEWDSSHTAFQEECLRDLEPALGRLGIRLLTRRGEAVAMLERLREETGFTLLVAHEETGTGVTYARDRRVRRWARKAGVEFLELPQTGVVRRLASRNGWNRLWEERMQSPQAALPRAVGRGGREMIARLETCGILGCGELGQPPDTKDRQRGGERAAQDVLDDFLSRRGRSYSGGISSPVTAATACSRLSPHLAFGTLSMRRVWQASEARRLEVVAGLAVATSPGERQTLRAWQRSLRAVQQAAGCRIGSDYPAPIVDHAAAVREAKRRLAEIRGSTAARSQAREVARRHGSRKDRRGAMQQDPVRRHLEREPRDAPSTAGRRIPDPQRRLPFADDDQTTP